ncbi:hypothetical protein J2D73_11625 [Acetobacter sacchari]|uniref:Uncharacterized protein n=1 Tax=Acetobacter sacchari TaxID=2661687 RepID=A0ABS3LWY7_9PROT|nr:hypothetical protein [Acetobacter sacchari]MBO1360437.1 hypothetical protein [Acetobacter sacchari]
MSSSAGGVLDGGLSYSDLYAANPTNSSPDGTDFVSSLSQFTAASQSATSNNAPLETLASEIAATLSQAYAQMAKSGASSQGSATSAPTQSGGAGTPVGNTGLTLSGNLNQDMQTLQQLVNGVGTNGNTLQQYAYSVAEEAQKQGRGLDGNVAHNIGASLSDGTYSQQGSSNAITAALQGQGVDALTNNVGVIMNQLKSGQSNQSIANNLNSLAKEASNAGNSGLASLASQLARQANAGTLDNNRAASSLQAYGASNGGVQVAGIALTGNLQQDMQTLQQLVNGTGTNGNTLQRYAQVVAQEAQQAGNGVDANAASNVAASLANGTYNQQGSGAAIEAAEQGQSVNPIQNNINAIILQLASGQSTQSIANNLNALSQEAQQSGNSMVSDAANDLLSDLSRGYVDPGIAAAQLQMALSASNDAPTNFSAGSGVNPGLGDVSSNNANLKQMAGQLSATLQQVGLELGASQSA